MSVNGQRELANSILVDGVEASSNRNNDTTMRPSVDAIDEFKVLTSGYAAELGRASGAVIAAQSKSGTNRLHGKLTNVAKHSGAKVASVVLVGSDKEIQLTVEDDGVGFDPATTAARSGLGLISMRERLRLVGGRFSIKAGQPAARANQTA